MKLIFAKFSLHWWLPAGAVWIKFTGSFPLRVARVVMRREKAERDKSTVLCADYASCHKVNTPLVVLEAKGNIINCVEELRHFCNDLCQRLTTSCTTQGHLAVALLQNG